MEKKQSSDEIEDLYEGFEEREIEDDYFWGLSSVKFKNAILLTY